MKILTIIVPSYNVEKYLETALNSYSDVRFNELLEVIIVNDGSTDSTLEIAQRYAQKYPEIFRIITKENGGHGSTINVGMKKAIGKYFRVIDGDDWIHTENLYELLLKLQKIDDDIVCDVKREVDMLSGETKLFFLPDGILEDKSYSLKGLTADKRISAYIMMHTIMFKTEILKNNNIKLLEHTFYVDYEFIVKACSFCNTIRFYNVEVYQYLVGNANQSVSVRNMVLRHRQHYSVIQSLLLFYAEHKESDSFFIRFKIASICMTYFKILHLMFTEKNEGRKLAKELKNQLRTEYQPIWKIIWYKYFLLALLGRLPIKTSTFKKLHLI